MSLNYNIIDSFKLLMNAFKYDVFVSIIISSILFTIILIINKDKRIFNYIILGLNVILIVIISYYYMNDILKFKFSNPINNIYFYFFNSIIYLIIMTVICLKNKYKKINYVFYGLILINLLYSLFMTHYLNNIDLIVIGNIFSMIKFGNITHIIYYVTLLIIFIKSKFLTNKS